MARNGKRGGRGAVRIVEPRIQSEVGAIGLVAFAVLSLIALVWDQGAVLHWWRTSLLELLGWGAFVVPFLLLALAAEVWFDLLRRSAAIPIVGATIAFIALLALAQHFQAVEPATGESAGGHLGSAVAGVAAGAFGGVGAPIALFALVLVGVVLAANRTLADLVRPAWARRDAVKTLRPGLSFPGGTATRFGKGDEDEPEED